MIPSEPPSKTSQNVYSAQSCVKVTDLQTERNLKGEYRMYGFPLERNPIYAPIHARENASVSTGGCRFIRGHIGAYRCSCKDTRRCHKSKSAAVLVLTPRCFQYHDRYVSNLSNMFDKGEVKV